MASASDDFNRASLGSNWTQETSPAARYGIVSSTKLSRVSGDAELNCAYWNADTFNADQYSECTLLPSDTGVGPVVRASATNNFYYAHARTTGYNAIFVGKVVSGSHTQIAEISSVTAVNGDRLKLTVEGTTLKVYLNDVQKGTSYTDSSIASGQPGVFIYVGGYSWADAWEGGDLSVAGATFVPREHLSYRTF